MSSVNIVELVKSFLTLFSEFSLGHIVSEIFREGGGEGGCPPLRRCEVGRDPVGARVKSLSEGCAQEMKPTVDRSGIAFC